MAATAEKRKKRARGRGEFEASPDPGSKTKRPLDPDDVKRLNYAIMSVACSSAWLDTIMDALEQRVVWYLKDARRYKNFVCDDGQRRPRALSIPRKLEFLTDKHGRLKVTAAELLRLVQEVGLYPPQADDRPKYLVAVRRGRGKDRRPTDFIRVEEIHAGCDMRPCLTEHCTREYAAGDGKTETRSVLYPAHYTAADVRSGEQRCYTCYVNRNRIDPDFARELLDLYDSGLARGYLHLLVGEASASAEQFKTLDRARVWKEDAWRTKSVFKLGIDDVAAVDALMKFRWSVVVGGERGKGSARLERRGLKNLGMLDDFLNVYGHSLSQVPGLPAEAAAKIVKLLDDYPREGEFVKVRLQQRKLRDTVENDRDGDSADAVSL